MICSLLCAFNVAKFPFNVPIRNVLIGINNLAANSPVPQVRLSMNERQGKAMAYVQEHGEINLSAYRELCPFWSDETLRLDLANLVKRKMLVKNGRNKGTCYVLPE